MNHDSETVIRMQKLSDTFADYSVEEGRVTNDYNNYDDVYQDSYMECCICLNTFDYEFIIMNCCKKYIHKQCLMDWILSEYNKMVKCPMCIQNIENINTLITYEEFNNYIDIIIEREIYKNDNFSLVYIKFRFDRYLEIVNKLYNIGTYSTTDSEIEDINDKLRFGCRIVCIFIYFIFIILIVYILNIYAFKK